MLRALGAAVGLVALVGLAPGRAGAGSPVGVLVLKEHGVGSATHAQPYVDKLVGITAKLNAWSGARGEYHTKRHAAKKFMAEAGPHYGILSLGAFLAFRGPEKLEVVGQAKVVGGGGQQYFIVSKTKGDLGVCKGKTLASNHVDDARFIEKVVAKGAFKLADFSVVSSLRPLQPIKKLVRDEAVCALIDDAQYAELGKMAGAGGIKPVWKSAELPPMVIAAFPAATAAERKSFQASLSRICEGEGKSVCAEVGLQSLKAAGPTDYATVVAAYE